MAISGNTAVVGAYLKDVKGNFDQGSAYVFVRSGSAWSEQAQLNANDGEAGDQFGISVAISGETIVVGASADTVDGRTGQGSAYVFVRSGVNWSQQTKLIANDGLAADTFGNSVAISGNTVIVGAMGDNVGANIAQGSAYIYVRSETTWTQQAHLFANNGAALDFFGVAVAIGGDTAVVGAWSDNVGVNSNQSSAYVFVRSGTDWSHQANLTANDGQSDDQFGGSVASSGESVVIGAPFDEIGDNFAQGSAYVFVRSGVVWTQQAKLVAGDGAAEDSFGSSVAITGGTVIVGAPLDDIGDNENQGSAYIFTRSGTSWSQQTKLTASDGAANDQFGFSVTVSGNTFIAGAVPCDCDQSGHTARRADRHAL